MVGRMVEWDFIETKLATKHIKEAHSVDVGMADVEVASEINRSFWMDIRDFIKSC